MVVVVAVVAVVVVVVVVVSSLLFQVLMNAGAIPGLDITPEAALAKLAHVLSLPIRSKKRPFGSWNSLIFLAFSK